MTHLPELPCYLNGEFTTLPHAKISVMDRGFIFGDGIYEVVPVYGGTLFCFEQHMARLERSLQEMRISNPATRAQWAEIAHKLIAGYALSIRDNSQKPDQLIYIQITRGVALRDHAMPADITPTVFVMTNQMKPPSEVQRSQGVACVTADDFRWEKAHIKATSLLGAVFARQISVDVGATETVMFRDGDLSEASSSNVWVVKDGQLFGPPKGRASATGSLRRCVPSWASPSRCGASAALRSWRLTKCCCRPPSKRCWRSPNWMASRWAVAARARSTPGCTRPTSRPKRQRVRPQPSAETNRARLTS